MGGLNKRIKSVKKDKDLNRKDVSKAKAPQSSNTKGLPIRVISHVVVITSLLTVVYFTSKHEIRIFARQSEVLSGKVQTLQCSPQYIKEINNYKACIPNNCKRLVTDTVLSSLEIESLLTIAQKGFQYGRSLGGASIIDLHSGAMSKGQVFINIYESQNMRNVFTQEDFQLFQTVKEKVKYTISNHFDVQVDNIYLTHPAFLSEITAREAVTQHDEYWHPHVDKETYSTFHFTSLVYLNDYNIDFEGGRFVFIDEKYNTTIEPRKGRLSIFTSGHENLHFVEKVKSGVRYAMTIAFTCDQKQAIKDPNVEKYKNP